MPVRTLGQIIERNERPFPRRPALVAAGRRRTHHEFATRAQKLAERPAVAAAAAVGRPDPDWGGAVHAPVIRRPDTDVQANALIAFCKTRIASCKCLKSLACIAELPRLATGKIDKVELRQPFITKN